MPYIYEDRISQGDFEATLTKALKLTKAKYKKMSEAGIKHVKENYNFENFEKQWIDFMDKTIEHHGSWETRKNYNRWTLKEIA